MKKPLTHTYYNRPFFSADMRADGTLELLCYEDIGENFWTGGGVTAKLIKQQIDGAGDEYSNILLRINSPGGDVFESIAIFNLLRSQNKPIEVRIDGLAASAASLLAMAGDRIVMGANAMMMIHNAWSLCVGDASEMREMAKRLDKVSDVIAGTYVRRTARSMADVKALMDEETWMTAEEAVSAQFATVIDPEPDEQVEQNALAIARRFRGFLGNFKRVPDRFLSSSAQCECSCEECESGNCSRCSNEDCEDKACLDCPMQARADLAALEERLAGFDRALSV
jgi:ATP-dependent protease ClpP protease subunit